MARGRRILLLAALLLGGCASVQDVTGVATQQDLLQLRTDVTIAQQRAQRALGEAEAALAQAQRRERERDGDAERRLAALAERVDALTSSLTTLSGQLDELNSRVDALSRQPRAAAPAPAAPRPPGTVPAVPTPSPSPPPAAAGNRPTTNALQPQDIYQAAYLDFSKGSYALAIAGFREFLRRFPDQGLAGAAQYWIGEAHFSLARGYTNAGQSPQATEALEQAVQEFRKVLANYPRSDKAPASLYKEALVLLELKQPAVAEQRLQYLVETFPQSEESTLARERLAALRPR
jgi:tol-pal system protein YbgF